MKTLQEEFEKNANRVGTHIFTKVKEGVSPNGNHVYIYERSLNGTSVAFEAFTASVKAAGTYPLPNGASITYEEDFEEYPGASKFGLTAYYCKSFRGAKKRFEQMISSAIEIPITDGLEMPIEDDEVAPDGVEEAPIKSDEVSISDPSLPRRGRQKGPRPELTLPDGKFSTDDLAKANNVGYPIAYVFIKEHLGTTIKEDGSERRAARGKMTILYSKI